MRATWVARLALVGFAAVAVVVPSTVAVAKSTVPYTDPRSTGSIALCNAAGQNITHGSVYDKPFAYRAVSSVPAPTQDQIQGRKATLYAFQPRKGVDSSQWNGENLTASSAYTNPLVPMAEGSKRDHALSDYLDTYPLAWGNFVQLRLIMSAPNASTDTSSYPTATIEVTGLTWTLLDPTQLSCNSGSASTSLDLLPPNDPIGLESPEPLYKLTPGVVVIGTPPANLLVTSASSRGGGPSGSAVGVAAAAVGGLFAIGGGAFWWRRRSHAAQ
jgi:hypothetical protein